MDETPVDWRRLTVDARRRAWAAPVAALVILAAALLLRFGQVGNPLAGLDEQFYLLVGDRMWHGELPYVDLWDRKPLGLFVLFAAIRLLPGDGLVAAQLTATAFAAVTAWFVTLIARRSVGWAPAAMAAIFYLAGLNELWGETTQTPVFYNALIAAAALLTLRAADRNDAAGRTALAAVLLAGLAIQIKTSAIFQGAFFGGWLVWARWRATRAARPTLSLTAALILVGALPTLAAMATYAALGRFDAWWQANVLSILAKGMPTDAAASNSLWESVILGSPMLALALLGFWAATKRFTRWDTDLSFVAGWIGLACVDFAALGGYYAHYALPLLLASTPLIARAFALGRLGKMLFGLALAWPAVHAIMLTPRIAAAEQGYAVRAVAAIPADVRTRCLFIFEGPVAYYRLTDACRVTRFVFTAHLSSRREGPSLGVDPRAALLAAMARRPGTAMTIEHSSWPDGDPAMRRLMLGLLHRDYHLIARLPHRRYATEERVLIWRLNGLP